MAKTIITTATLHIKDDKRSTADVWDATRSILLRAGRAVFIPVPPDTAVAFEDETEADAIVARHGGEVITDGSRPAIITVRARPADVVDTIIPFDPEQIAAEAAAAAAEAEAPKGRGKAA